MSKFQYQPLTGPVWREPVADRLSWLPAGQPRSPARAPNAVGGYVIPFVAAVAAATSLAWLPSGNVRAQSVPSPVAVSVIALFQPPATFDASQFPATYVLQLVPVERRRPSDLVEPIMAALYRPDGLQWSPTGAVYGVRQAPRPVQTWSLLSPSPVATPFDPAAFPWTAVTWFRFLERRAAGGIVQPFTQALYRPEGLQWVPSGNVPWRTLLPNRLGWVVGDPLPHVTIVVALPLQLEDRSGFRYGVLDQGTKRYLLIEQSGMRYVVEEDSAPKQEAEDRSSPKYPTQDGST